MRTIALIVVLSVAGFGCSNSKLSEKDLAPDRTVVPSAQYPTAIDPKLVGAYPARTKSGAGYFYDDVLEYRVWIHPKGGGDDYYRAFASYERALDFSRRTSGAEEPLALVRQRASVALDPSGAIRLTAKAAVLQEAAQ